MKYSGYGSTYQSSRESLKKRLVKKDFDHKGTLEDMIDKIDDWIKDTFDDADITSFLIEFDKETNTIIVCHYQNYTLFNVGKQ